MRSTFPPGCLALALILLLFILLPFFLADVLLTALGKLGLSPSASLLAVFGIFFGSFVNIPVQYIDKEQPKELDQQGMFGMDRMLFGGVQEPEKILLAMNLGGCVIPLFIAIYELLRLSEVGTNVLVMALFCVVINVVVCEWLAKPVPNMGISINALVPGLLAAFSALILVPEQAPPAAFTAGVLGPLVGADLLHLRDIQRISSGVASIGGAGTFDGIVLSGIIATLLA